MDKPGVGTQGVRGRRLVSEDVPGCGEWRGASRDTRTYSLPEGPGPVEEGVVISPTPVSVGCGNSPLLSKSTTWDNPSHGWKKRWNGSRRVGGKTSTAPAVVVVPVTGPEAPRPYSRSHTYPLHTVHHGSTIED